MSNEPFMESGHGYFTAEQVDEQIDQLRQAKATDGPGNEAQLVSALQRYHTPTLQAEDRAALERARQRITVAAHDAGTFDNQAPLAPVPPTSLCCARAWHALCAYSERPRGCRSGRHLAGKLVSSNAYGLYSHNLRP